MYFFSSQTPKCPSSHMMLRLKWWHQVRLEAGLKILFFKHTGSREWSSSLSAILFLTTHCCSRVISSPVLICCMLKFLDIELLSLLDPPSVDATTRTSLVHLCHLPHLSWITWIQATSTSLPLPTDPSAASLGFPPHGASPLTQPEPTTILLYS